MDKQDVVFSKSTGHFTSPRGHTVLVVFGSHWHKDDEMVRTFPDNFSDDPAFGLSVSLMPVAEPVPHQPPQTAKSTKLPPPPKKD